ncbi:branched-chain amino acid ABC transporter permease [Bosea sp. 2KB_26]|uniref:branched-chain amino acid ABC transporter permease n=1 Tax=Bosea sp. 2KB_26 TaxID=3237475 RepID=UPI003F8F9B47
MSASLVMQAILSGITNGFVYALIGIGLAVIFKGTQIINAMQGEFAVIGAMVTVFALEPAGLPYGLSILLGVVSGASVGLIIDRLFVQPMMRQRAGEESFLLLTIGLAVTLSAAVLYLAGRNSYLLPSWGEEGVIEILDAFLQIQALWLIGAAIIVVVALRLFYGRTLLGLSMMAASMDPDGAATNGINVQRMRSLTFLLGGTVGAIAGILVAPLIAVNYHMGIALTLKGFAAAILGGLSNPLGAVLGGVTLGLLESLAVVGFPSGYKDVIALAMMIVIMIVMPNGLLGRVGRIGG